MRNMWKALVRGENYLRRKLKKKGNPERKERNKRLKISISVSACVGDGEGYLFCVPFTWQEEKNTHK